MSYDMHPSDMENTYCDGCPLRGTVSDCFGLCGDDPLPCHQENEAIVEARNLYVAAAAGRHAHCHRDYWTERNGDACDTLINLGHNLIDAVNSAAYCRHKTLTLVPAEEQSGWEVYVDIVRRVRCERVVKTGLDALHRPYEFCVGHNDPR